MSIENYKNSYERMVRLRGEFANKKGYVRVKGEDEKAYHQAKKSFGQFKPEHIKSMEDNTNNGKGADVQLKNGEKVHLNNQKELYDIIGEYNREKGAFYDLKHIKKTNPKDIERLNNTNQYFDQAKEELKKTIENNYDRNQIMFRLENVVNSKIDKEKKDKFKNDILLKANEEIKFNKTKVETKKEEKKIEKSKDDKSLNAKASSITMLTKDKDKPNQEITDDLNKKFLIAGNSDKAKYFYKNKPEIQAFEDAGKKMITESSSKNVAASMVELAEVKNWQTLKVKGSEEFKSEIWIQASLKGIKVTGYKPNEKDVALLDEKLKVQVKNSIEAERIKEINSIESSQVKNKDNINELADNVPKNQPLSKADQNVINMRDKIHKEEMDQQLVRAKEYLKDYVTLNKKETLKKHPELERVYQLEKAAKQFIDHPQNLIKMNAKDKARFVESVRDKGINVISKGEMLPKINQVAKESPQQTKTNDIER